MKNFVVTHCKEGVEVRLNQEHEIAAHLLKKKIDLQSNLSKRSIDSFIYFSLSLYFILCPPLFPQGTTALGKNDINLDTESIMKYSIQAIRWLGFLKPTHTNRILRNVVLKWIEVGINCLAHKSTQSHTFKSMCSCPENALWWNDKFKPQQGSRLFFQPINTILHNSIWCWPIHTSGESVCNVLKTLQADKMA